MGDSQFNAVAILDALPEGDLNTAHHLLEDLRDVSCYIAHGLDVRYFQIQTTNDLESAISSLKQEAETGGLIPWLHLEGHGLRDESGVVTANGSSCSWAHLKTLLTPLNIATNLNVVIVLATCYGGSFATAITTIDRAPVLAMIGPTHEIEAGEIEADFPAFYKTFFETGSLKQAVSALTAERPNLYYRTTAERFFYEVWASYKVQECSREQIAVRARRLYRRAKREGLSPIPSIGKLKRMLLGKEEEVFEKYRNKYFMYDLHKENRVRFPVTYRKAERFMAR